MSQAGDVIVHAASPPRRQAPRLRQWWARAWDRAAEEAAYGEPDLTAGRRHARTGRVGGLRLEPGRVTAAVGTDEALATVVVSVPLLDEADATALVEVVLAEPARATALLAGDLPHDLVEHAEEAGVELLPYGGELVCECTCRHWVDPCEHALAVLVQVGWLLEADPLLLWHLRGLPRARLLARVREARPVLDAAQRSLEGAGEGAGEGSGEEPELDLAVDAAVRAQRFLAWLEEHHDPDDDPPAHLLP
ncbi:SWIM zinc finger family protein [Nocardioides sp. BSK12Z-3]|nr:SWIM zinc finger family protein [Nocardioides bruguierae]